MGKKRRVAIVINLDFAFKRHHAVFAGTQQFAEEHANWQSEVWPFPPPSLTKGGRPMFDGIIARVTPALAEAARGAGTPLVNVWHSSPAHDVPMVSHDAHRVGFLAGEHLQLRGFRRFAYIGLKRNPASREREAGFQAAVQAGPGDYSRLSVATSYGKNPKAWERYHRETTEWLGGLTTPVGLFALNDIMARHTITIAVSLGMRIPDDLAIVGAENDPIICLNPEPTLTSIDVNYEGVGYRAAELLDEIMSGGKAPSDPILLPPKELIARGSTDAFAADGSLVADALRFMADECHRPIRVEDVVAHVPATWRTLDRHFEKERGRTIAAELNHMRLQRAKRLLADSTMPVKAVAKASGYSSSKRLCEAFARAEGISPGDYRRRYVEGE